MDTDNLTSQELALIERYLSFYINLDGGALRPSTSAQEQFVQVCRGKRAPETEHEIAYFKWKLLKAQELRQQQAIQSSKRSVTSDTTTRTATAASPVNKGAKVAPQSKLVEEEVPIRSNEIIWPKKIDEDFWKLPEFEEGYPRSEFGTREEHKAMRGRQRSATKRGRHS